MSASQDNTRYLFALEPPISAVSDIQNLLKMPDPPSTVAGHDTDGSSITFVLLPTSSTDPITRSPYPKPPTFKPVALAAKATPLPTLGTVTTPSKLPPSQPQPATESQNAFPFPYFFYGTLADPRILKDELNLDIEPELEDASIQRGKLRMWGQYYALVDGEAQEVVKGSMFEVKSEEQELLLRFY